MFIVHCAFGNSTTLDLHVRESSEIVEREKALQSWYRRELKGIAPPLFEKWAESVQIPAPQWGIKRMKTKWDSCNIEARRIWLNLELIKKPHHCLEYVIVHAETKATQNRAATHSILAAASFSSRADW